jgi:hypothetical protein
MRLKKKTEMDIGQGNKDMIRFGKNIERPKEKETKIQQTKKHKILKHKKNGRLKKNLMLMILHSLLDY